MVLGAAPAGRRVWFAPMVVLSRALQTSSTPQQAHIATEPLGTAQPRAPLPSSGWQSPRGISQLQQGEARERGRRSHERAGIRSIIPLRAHRIHPGCDEG